MIYFFFSFFCQLQHIKFYDNNVQLLSVMVQACCLALIDASIPMTSVFAGVTCAYTNDDKFILDPNLEQEQVSENDINRNNNYYIIITSLTSKWLV